MSPEKPFVWHTQHLEAGLSRYVRCSVCRNVYERGQPCTRCQHDQPLEDHRRRLGLLQEPWRFIQNPAGITAAIIGVVAPWLAVFLLIAMLLFQRPNQEDRLFNLALLLLIFLVWTALVDQGIILFIYFLRDQLCDYQWSWPVYKGRRPGVVQLAGLTLVLFLGFALLTALVPVMWSAGSTTIMTLGLTGQDFWGGVLVAFLFSLPFATLVLGLMLLSAKDYINRRNAQRVPPIYTDVDLLLDVVLRACHKRLRVNSSTVVSAERTPQGGLKLLLKVLPPPPEASGAASADKAAPPTADQPPASGADQGKPAGESSSTSPYVRYEVESDPWGALVSLKEKKDW